MENLHEVAKIIFPDERFIENKELFVRYYEEELAVWGRLQKTCRYRFDTWMNLFAGKKYYYYCDMGKLYLKLNISGKSVVNILGCNRNSAFGKIEDIIINCDAEGETFIEIPNAQNYDAVYFEIISPLKNPCEILNASWMTDKEPNYDNKLAVVCCTFKRENYITRNIRQFERFKSENPAIQNKINMFVSDNGKTLPESLNSNNVTIYPNMNAGGAGGFTRGLLEVMKLNQGYTRVLFMDDDVEMFPEAFYRTLILSNYLKKEYKDAIINGAMIDLYDKSRFYESIAVQTKDWVTPYHRQVNLNTLDNVLYVNKTPESIFYNPAKRVSSAWWYCSFSMETFEKKGLPLPVFFRCDDIEYSWRNVELPAIQLNGICVWHSAFAWRTSGVTDYYYSKRNYNMINFIHNKNFRKQFFKNLKNDFKNLTKKYDYDNCEIYLKMMSDLLEGPEVFKQNPEKQFAQIRAIAQKTQYHDCNTNELDELKNYYTKEKKWRKWLYYFTKRGRYCPKFLFKKSEIAPECFTSSSPFILSKQVKIYNLFTGKYYIREFDADKLGKLRKQFKSLYKTFEKNYERIENEYKKAFNEMITKDFWNEYLGLNNIKTENSIDA